MRENFYTKLSKVMNVQVPGLLDPTLSTAVAKESLIKMVGIIQMFVPYSLRM